jgi:hypothetical protein
MKLNPSARAQTILGKTVLISVHVILDNIIFASSYMNSWPRIFTYSVGSPLNAVLQRLYGHRMWRDVLRWRGRGVQKPLTLRINEPEE